MSREDLRSHLLAAPADELAAEARRLRDAGFGHTVSYSRKVFVPLTRLCRDVCHYCTFAAPPRRGVPAYLSPDEVLAIAEAGRAAGCKEALFTLGDKPELRYRAAREALAALGFETTIDYLVHAARLVFEETGLLPHVNPGVLSRADIAALREVSVSQGIMLESVSPRLARRGGPHFGSPDKRPGPRLATLREAGGLAVPFTTGILIGIGETRGERLDALFAIADIQREHGHIQEVIVQNFRAKPGTKMAEAPEPAPEDLAWTVAAARHVLGPAMSIQAPPNLSAETYPDLIAAGLNDWGGVSPVTPDHVNPEAPWPEIASLAERSAAAGKILVERLAVYPSYALDVDRWVDPALAAAVRRAIDAEGFAREDGWSTGVAEDPPADRGVRAPAIRTDDLAPILDRAAAGERLNTGEIVELFGARAGRFDAVVGAADAIRREISGDVVTYVVNRNINYTNICTYACRFCAFSKGRSSAGLRGTPYDLDLEEISRRVSEAWERGATEVCLQGGIHPDYTGETYISIARRGEADGARHACPRLLAARNQPGRGDAWTPRGCLPRTPGRCRAGLASRDRGGNPRPADPQDPVPRQGHGERVAVGDPQRASSRPQHHGDHHVRQRRGAGLLGAPPQRNSRSANRDRRVHRIRAAALRPYGGADLSARQGAQGAELARGGADARGGAARPQPGHSQHPGVLGEDGARGRRGLPRRRGQRSRRHADEREHLARRRHVARPGAAARGDGGADRARRAAAATALDGLRSGHRGADRRRARRPAARADRRRTVSELPVIAIVGGTGAEGSGLAIRWARAGYRVILGSRSAGRAAGKAAELAGHGSVEGAANADAAAAADIVVVTVPFAAQRQTMTDIADAARGKTVIDVTVPLVPPRVARVQLPHRKARRPPSRSRSWAKRHGWCRRSRTSPPITSPIPDTSSTATCWSAATRRRRAREAVTLIEAAGLRGIEAGPLANAVAAEALTSVLIWINRRYDSPGSGIRITGLPGDTG